MFVADECLGGFVLVLIFIGISSDNIYNVVLACTIQQSELAVQFS